MDARTLTILLLVLSPLVDAWKTANDDRRQARELRTRGVHHHSKRHNVKPADEMEPKRRGTTSRPNREIRKKPSGQLTPLEEDDIENDEGVSVAIGPPPIRPKYEKAWKHAPKPANANQDNQENATATNLVKEVMYQLGREFLTRQVSEDFVFGQYVGNAMKNLTSELKLKMQHEILELVVKYQTVNRGEGTLTNKATTMGQIKDMGKDATTEKIRINNETNNEEPWPDFSNLAKIVG